MHVEINIPPIFACCCLFSLLQENICQWQGSALAEIQVLLCYVLLHILHSPSSPPPPPPPPHRKHSFPSNISGTANTVDTLGICPIFMCADGVRGAGLTFVLKTRPLQARARGARRTQRSLSTRRRRTPTCSSWRPPENFIARLAMSEIYSFRSDNSIRSKGSREDNNYYSLCSYNYIKKVLWR